MPQSSFFDLDDRLASLKDEGDPLVCLSERIDFERFRPQLKRLLKLSSLSRKGGRPPFDPVLMFKILVLQSLYNYQLIRRSIKSSPSYILKSCYIKESLDLFLTQFLPSPLARGEGSRRGVTVTPLVRFVHVF